MDTLIERIESDGRSDRAWITRARLSPIVAAALVLCTFAARADVISDWDIITFDTLKAANIGGNPAARALAIVHVSMSDAVNTVQNRYTRYALEASLNSAAPAKVPGSSRRILPTRK